LPVCEIPAVAFEALLITLLCGTGKRSFAGSVVGQAQAWLSGRGQLFSPNGKVAIYHSAAKGRLFWYSKGHWFCLGC